MDYLAAEILAQLHADHAMVCVCGRIIPDNAIVYGFPLSEDADQPIAWVNEWHDHCLGEWGWVRDDSEWGITHVFDRVEAIPLTEDQERAYTIGDEDFPST